MPEARICFTGEADLPVPGRAADWLGPNPGAGEGRGRLTATGTEGAELEDETTGVEGI